MNLSGLAIHDHGPIREIRMDRPPVNALDAGLVQALLDALKPPTDPAIRAFVLSGQPGIFSAGLDLPSLLALDRDGMAAFWRQLVVLLRTIARSPVPVLAAMTGHSPAGGTVLCLYADYRVMAQGDYRVGLNEVQVGLPVPDFIQRGLVRLVGPRQAGSLVMGGSLIGPDDARTIGLVDELAAPEQVLECALRRARQWLALPQLAFQATREISRRDLRFMDQDPAEIETLVTFWFRPETQEALHRYVDSFRKRRDPDPDRPRRSKT